MADKTVADLDAALVADFIDETEIETQVPGLTSPESRRGTFAQLRQIMLWLARLVATNAAALSATAMFPVYDAAFADPDGANARSLTLAEMQKAMVTRSRVKLHAERAKVGATAGWVVAAATDLGKMATIPQSQTGSTLVVPLTDFVIGEILTAFSAIGSLQSAGNNVSFNIELRMLTVNAAGAVDSSLGALGALTVAANTILGVGNTTKALAGAGHTIAVGESFYLLITATTAATTTGEVQGVLVTSTGA